MFWTHLLGGLFVFVQNVFQKCLGVVGTIPDPSWTISDPFWQQKKNSAKLSTQIIQTYSLGPSAQALLGPFICWAPGHVRPILGDSIVGPGPCWAHWKSIKTNCLVKVCNVWSKTHFQPVTRACVDDYPYHCIIENYPYHRIIEKHAWNQTNLRITRKTVWLRLTHSVVWHAHIVKMQSYCERNAFNKVWLVIQQLRTRQLK